MTPSVDRPAYATKWLGRPIYRFGQVSSTSDEAARLARAGAGHGTAVVASGQTHGRGRYGRSWYSPEGENLYLSIVLRLDIAAALVPPLTLAAGVAVVDAVRGTGVSAVLKWPNDVMVGERKLSGILAEMSCQDERVEFVVLGLGINLNTSELPPELNATSLRRELGHEVAIEPFLVTLLSALETGIDRFIAEGPEPIALAWKERSPILGKRVAIRSGAAEPGIVGTARDIDEQGALLVDADDGRGLRVIAGEIQVIE